MATREGKTSLSGSILNGQVGVRAMRERMCKGIKVRYKALICTEEQSNKGEKGANAGDNPADILHTERDLCPGGHRNSDNDDEQQPEPEGPPCTGRIGSTDRVTSTNQAAVIEDCSQHRQC